MFTGIITALGSIAEMQRKPDGGAKIYIETPWDCNEIPIGASIACSGICLTLVEANNNRFVVDASDETINLTTMVNWSKGKRINLERALALGDELGGHMVSGHVDGKAVVTRIEREGDSYLLAFDVPDHLAPFIATKGSVALDGISLTVNRVKGSEFEIMVIPHTWMHTTLAEVKPESEINLEVDMLARYVARMTEFEKGKNS